MLRLRGFFLLPEFVILGKQFGINLEILGQERGVADDGGLLLGRRLVARGQEAGREVLLHLYAAGVTWRQQARVRRLDLEILG